MNLPSTINHQPSTSLLLIGCGNMGGALLARWAEIYSVAVVEPRQVMRHKNVSVVERISDLPEKFSPRMVVLAVKPQQLDEVLPDLAKKLNGAPAYLSIAAGKHIAYYEKHLGQGAEIVRAMPNTPAMIGQGMTVLCRNRNVSPASRELATRLMEAAGDVLWVEDEGLMDAVTAISGSGPAYLYYIIECMVKAGVKNGLAHAQAAQLALKTCAGASALALESKEDVEILRRQVTSPGGTTEAALKVLQEGDALAQLIDAAVAAAVKRAKEL